MNQQNEPLSREIINNRNRPLRAIILTTKLPQDIWLINKISEVCNIEGIVFPFGSRYKEYGLRNVFKKRIRRFGPFTVANQALLVLYRLFVESRKDKKAVKELFADKPHTHIEKTDTDILEVDDINFEKVERFIVLKAPQLVIVSGTPLLKKRIIEAAEGRIINLHPGLAHNTGEGTVHSGLYTIGSLKWLV